MIEGGTLKGFTAIALQGFPLIAPGNDIAKIIVETANNNNIQIENGDILAIAQKIFSKAENRIVKLENVVASNDAQKIASITGKSPEFVELVLRETENVLIASPEILLVEDKRGLVVINAGIDKSNVKGIDHFTLLPKNPDRSAENCRLGVKKITGKDVAVIMCDTYSRPFRRGQVNFAIGISGVKPFYDYRGKRDLFGYVLKVKNVAVVDEIAAAAEILMGQSKQATPVVIFKGLKDLVEFADNHQITEIRISSNEDLFKGSF